MTGQASKWIAILGLATLVAGTTPAQGAPAPAPGRAPVKKSAPAPPPVKPAARSAPAATAKTPPKPAPSNPAAGTEGTFSDQVSVAWILVPVTVRSRSGFVRGLDKNDFEMRVDGQPVRFPDFEPRGEVPWSIVFLQDLSGSMAVGGRLDSSREAILQFLDGAKFGDEFALASFAGSTTAVDVPFTEDQQPLRETLAGWEAYGRTALHDAVAMLPRITGESRNLKRAAVLITDGVDNASRITPAQARDLVRQAELPVYVLGLESGDPNVVSPEGQKLYRYADVLNLLASLTGGRYFSIHGPDELKEACATIADELRYQYVLGFETRPTGENRFRPIWVSVKKRDVIVNARKGYKGTPPAP